MTINPLEYLEQPYGDYTGLIAAWGRERPDRVALDDGEESLNWAQVSAVVERIAAQLQRDGLKKGQAVAILGTSSVRYALAYLGAVRAKPEAGKIIARLRAANSAMTILARAHSEAEVRHLLENGADGTVLAERELAYSMAEMVLSDPRLSSATP